jgi:hypothetical protein
MVRTNGSTQFVDSVSQRFVLSWYHKRPRILFTQLTSNPTVTSASLIEIQASSRAEFLAWLVASGLGHGVVATGQAAAYGSGASLTIGMQMAWDGSVVGGTIARYTTPGASSEGTLATHAATMTLAEGYHYASLFGQISSGTATFSSGSLQVTIFG